MNRWILGIVVALLAVAMLRRRGESTPSLGGAPPAEADIDHLIASGRKIEAIKLYRRLHGTDLKDATDAVEARAKNLPRPQG